MNLSIRAGREGFDPFPGFSRHRGKFVIRRQGGVADRIQPGAHLFGQGEHFRRE